MISPPRLFFWTRFQEVQMAAEEVSEDKSAC